MIYPFEHDIGGWWSSALPHLHFRAGPSGPWPCGRGCFAACCRAAMVFGGDGSCFRRARAPRRAPQQLSGGRLALNVVMACWQWLPRGTSTARLLLLRRVVTFYPAWPQPVLICSP